MRFREATLEDGEKVVLLVGVPGPSGRWKSDAAHSGVWSSTHSYLLIPHSRPNLLVKKLAKLMPDMENRSGDCEVLVLAPHDQVRRVLESGPSAARARRRRPPSDPSALVPFQFQAQP
jgi:hypothetical protein